MSTESGASVGDDFLALFSSLIIDSCALVAFQGDRIFAFGGSVFEGRIGINKSNCQSLSSLCLFHSFLIVVVVEGEGIQISSIVIRCCTEVEGLFCFVSRLT